MCTQRLDSASRGPQEVMALQLDGQDTRLKAPPRATASGSAVGHSCPTRRLDKSAEEICGQTLGVPSYDVRT